MHHVRYDFDSAYTISRIFTVIYFINVNSLEKPVVFYKSLNERVSYDQKTN